MLDKTKIMYGPATVTFLADAVEKLTLTAVKDDVFKLSGAEKKGGREVEDGGELKWDAGGTLQLEITFSELDPTDLADVKDANKVTVDFTNLTKTLTIDGTDAAVFEYDVEVGIDGLSTKVIFWVSYGVGSNLDDMFEIA